MLSMGFHFSLLRSLIGKFNSRNWRISISIPSELSRGAWLEVENHLLECAEKRAWCYFYWSKPIKNSWFVKFYPVIWHCLCKWTKTAFLCTIVNSNISKRHLIFWISYCCNKLTLTMMGDLFYHIYYIHFHSQHNQCKITNKISHQSILSLHKPKRILYLSQKYYYH